MTERRRRYLWPQYKNSVRRRLREVQRDLCPLCGGRLAPASMKPAQLADPDSIASIEHVVPFRYGGHDGPGNFVLTHFGCNQARKSAMPTGCLLVWLLAVNAHLGWSPTTW